MHLVARWAQDNEIADIVVRALAVDMAHFQDIGNTEAAMRANRWICGEGDLSVVDSLFGAHLGTYFFFDGFVTWPKSNVRWLKHKEFEDAQNEMGWETYAAGQGWTSEVPHKFYEQKDIVGQYVCGSVLVTV